MKCDNKWNSLLVLIKVVSLLVSPHELKDVKNILKWLTV